MLAASVPGADPRHPGAGPRRRRPPCDGGLRSRTPSVCVRRPRWHVEPRPAAQVRGGLLDREGGDGLGVAGAAEEVPAAQDAAGPVAATAEP